jgi:hypothetical protein
LGLPESPIPKCAFYNQRAAGLIVGNTNAAGANSIGHVFNSCTFANSNGPAGVGVITNGGGPLYFNECNFSYLERGVVCKNAYISCLSLRNTDSEGTKRLVDGTGIVSGSFGSANSVSSLIISGGRIECNYAMLASTGPVVIPASDNNFIKWMGGQIHLDGAQLQSSSGGIVEARILAGFFCRVSANASLFPTKDLFLGSDCALSTQGCSYLWDTIGNVSAMPNGVKYYGAWQNWEGHAQFEYATFRADKLDVQTVRIRTGSGSPEGIVPAPVGSLYLRTDGGATTTLYVKTTGTGNTGWTAK